MNTFATSYEHMSRVLRRKPRVHSRGNYDLATKSLSADVSRATQSLMCHSAPYRYVDSGIEIPDVPRDRLRVLTLTVGMRVDARWRGGVGYYGGVIKGLNQRWVYVNERSTRCAIQALFSCIVNDGRFPSSMDHLHYSPLQGTCLSDWTMTC